MVTSAEPWQPLLEDLEKLRSDWPGGGWGWDPRFKCVASSFGKEISDRVRASMTGVLDQEWSAATMGDAPAEARALATKYGGVRTGQFLFIGRRVEGMHLYGLWWPWGDGATISLRVGIANCQRPTEAYPQVRAVFRIA